MVPDMQNIRVKGEIILMIDNYITWLKTEGKSEKTVNEYPVILKKLIKWYEETEGDGFSPDKVTTLHLHEFISYLDKIEEYEPSYVNKIIASLKTFYKYALDAKIVNYNPMLKVKMKRSMKQYAAPKWLSKQESAKYYHSVEQEKNTKKKARDLAISRMMSGAGLRVEEVSDLNITDICLGKRRENVTVREGKGNKHRIIPLNEDVIESLEEWYKYRGEASNYEPVFLSERNNRIGVRTIRYMVTGYAEKASLQDVSPHTLRHTFAKSLIDQGVGLEQFAYLLGHDNLETTRRYTQPGENDLRKSVQKISEKR
jgi:integrase/recombinase XerC